jgi:hypothetical protein
MPRKFTIARFSFIQITTIVIFNLTGSEGTPICKYDQHFNCLDNAQVMISQFSQLNFVCDSSAIDQEIDCNCLSSCDEIFYEIQDKDRYNYKRDEIESKMQFIYLVDYMKG